jgi:hypothetical protein
MGLNINILGSCRRSLSNGNKDGEIKINELSFVEN